MVTFNGIDRLIEVTDSNDVSLDVEQDIYSAWKDWSQIGDNSKYAPALRTFGGDDTATGQTAPKYFFLQNFWRVFINNGEVVSIAINLYSDNFATPYLVAAGSGVSARNSDAVNVNEEEIKDGTFTGNRVHINTVGRGLPGTVYPRGNGGNPVDNYPDAKIIADERNFVAYDLVGTVTFLAGDDLSTTDWLGKGLYTSGLTLTGGDTTGMILKLLHLGGTVNGPVTGVDLHLQDLSNFSGECRNCAIAGTLGLDATNTDVVSLVNLFSAVAGVGRPILNVNGTMAPVSARNITGGLTVTNATAGNSMSFDFVAGTLEIDSSCTAGIINVGGNVLLIDNSGPGCTVVRERTVTDLIWNPQTSDYQVAGSTGEAVSSGGALTVDQATQLEEIWQFQGLDLANPLVLTDVLKTVGAKELSVTCLPDGSVVVQRQP